MAYIDYEIRVDLSRIRRQLELKNELEILKQSYEMDIIDRETYVKRLKEAYVMLND